MSAWKHGFAGVMVVLAAAAAAGCSMREEVKRIEAVKQAEQRQDESRSTDLTGQQLFIRSCNTCHPGGKEGLGPALSQLDEHFPTDEGLKRFIRAGKGAMPAQPAEVINEREMSRLIAYLRSLKQ